MCSPAASDPGSISASSSFHPNRRVASATPRRALHDPAAALVNGADDLTNRPRRDVNQMDVCECDDLSPHPCPSSDLDESGVDSGTDDDQPPMPTRHYVSLRPALLVALSTPNSGAASLTPTSPIVANEIPPTGLFDAFVKLTKRASPNDAANSPTRALQFPSHADMQVPSATTLAMAGGSLPFDAAASSSLVGSAPGLAALSQS